MPNAANPPYNVLVFPGGTEIGLEIHRSLSHLKEVELFSVGSRASNHAPYVFQRHEVIPTVDDPQWIDALNEVIRRNKIDFVFPAHDDVLLALSESREQVAATVLVPPVETCKIARYKSLTYRSLERILPVPKLMSTAADVSEFPVFIKPDRGQGSQGCLLIQCQDELAFHLRRLKHHIICEYLPGKEYTVDCFSDRERGLLFCEGRERVRARSGIAVCSRHVQEPRFREYAEAISSKIRMWGAWFYQVKEDAQGVYRILEVAPRIAGTMGLHRVVGVNFALLSIYESLRIPVEIKPNRVDVTVDRSLVSRYTHDIKYSTVYVDYDDTLIVRAKVNLNLVRFLFQCINDKVKVILLTRHSADLSASLSTHRLIGIFDAIIHLKAGEAKSAFVREPDAIFIDDSFRERVEVSVRCNIPTFDTTMIEILFDDRQ